MFFVVEEKWSVHLTLKLKYSRALIPKTSPTIRQIASAPKEPFFTCPFASSSFFLFSPATGMDSDDFWDTLSPSELKTPPVKRIKELQKKAVIPQPLQLHQQKQKQKGGGKKQTTFLPVPGLNIFHPCYLHTSFSYPLQ